MNFWIFILPIITSASIAIGHRQTICRRIERVAGYIVDTRTEIEKASLDLDKKRKMFTDMGCVDRDESDSFDSGSAWADKMRRDMNEENFMQQWETFTPSVRSQHCIVLKQSIETRYSKLERRVASVETLQVLKGEYEKLLATYDRTGEIDPKWNRVLEIGEVYERYERGIRGMWNESVDFLKSKTFSETVGPMFWPPGETPKVVRELIDTFKRGEDNAEKLRICLEMILNSHPMKRFGIHLLVREIINEYNFQTTAKANDLLNAERAILSKKITVCKHIR